MKNFIQTKFEDYNPGVVCQKVLITLLLVRSQGIVIYKFFQRAVHYIIYYWQFTQSRSQQYHGPSQNQRRMLSLRCCLGAKRVLLFMIERVFWLMEEVWLMEKEGQRAEKICFSFSCLVRKCDFYFTVHKKFDYLLLICLMSF